MAIMLRSKGTPLQIKALHNLHRKKTRRARFGVLRTLNFPQKHPFLAPKSPFRAHFEGILDPKTPKKVKKGAPKSPFSTSITP